MADDKDTERDDAPENEEPTAEASDAAEESAPEAPVSEEALAAASDQDEVVDEQPEDEGLPIAALLGPERWVQFAFIVLAGVLFFVAERLTAVIWEQFAEPDMTIVSAVAAIIGILAAFLLYRDSRVNALSNEVVGELSKVTWPTKQETYVSTVVVIVTSLIAAVYTGLMDALWSAFTDLIYNV
jgi:preprotein translocase SecE subunit